MLFYIDPVDIYMTINVEFSTNSLSKHNDNDKPELNLYENLN